MDQEFKGAAAVVPDSEKPALCSAMASPSVSITPTPLAVRTWSKEVVRVVRVAVTGFKAIRQRYNDVCSQGEQSLNEGCNCLLQLLHLPAMPLGVLAGLPDLRGMAACKLARLALQHIQQLEAATQELVVLAQGASGHANSLQPLLQQQWQAADHATLVPSMGGTDAQRLLDQLAQPLSLDAADRCAVVAAVKGQLAAHIATLRLAIIGLPEVQGQKSADSKPLPAEQLSQRCQVWLSIWLLAPHRDTNQEDVILSVLTDALASAAL